MMKNMKKNHLVSILTAVCVLAVMASGCSKDPEGVVTMRGHVGQFGNSKVSLNGYLPEWTQGDSLKVNGVQYEISVSNHVAEWRMPSAAIYKAIYPARLVNSMTNSTVNMSIPQQQLYYVDASGKQIVNAPMGVCSTETNLVFKNLGALLAISIQNTSSNNIVVDKVTVKSINHAVALCGNAVVENFTPSAAEYYYRITDTPTESNNFIELVKGTSNPSLNIPITAGGSKVVYMYVPAVANLVENRYEITVDAHAGSENISVTRTQPESNPYAGTLQRNDMGSVTFLMESMTYPEGAIEGGLFSVSSTKQVFFSKGNLQYNSSLDEWQFASAQTEILGSQNERTARGADVWFDLFGWATSGQDMGYEDLLVTHIDPTSIVSKLSFTGNNRSGYGPSFNNGHNRDLVDDSRFFDWGVNVSTSDVEWRTLLGDEYEYLLNGRDFSGHRGLGYSFTYAVIAGVSGYIIYPDGCTTQESNGAILSAVPEGCVFLPYTGYRTSNSSTSEITYFSGDYMFYWSASAGSPEYNWSLAQEPNAQCLMLGNVANPVKVGSSNRGVGYAVRLVCDYVH